MAARHETAGRRSAHNSHSSGASDGSSTKQQQSLDEVSDEVEEEPFRIAREGENSSIKRLYVEELLITEKVYVMSLRRVSSRVLIPLHRALGEGHAILTHEQIKAIFSNYELLLQTNEGFMKKLAARVSNWSQCPTVVDIFAELAPFLGRYLSYIESLSFSLSNLEKACTENTRFLQLITSFDEELADEQLSLVGSPPRTSESTNDDENGNGNDNGASLRAYLQLPLQRVQQYARVLAALLDNTHLSDTDIVRLQSLAEEFEGAVSSINESLGSNLITTEDEVVRIQKELDLTDLVTPTRILIRYDQFISAQTNQTVHSYLFSDLILCATNPGHGQATVLLREPIWSLVLLCESSFSEDQVCLQALPSTSRSLPASSTSDTASTTTTPPNQGLWLRELVASGSGMGSWITEVLSVQEAYLMHHPIQAAKRRSNNLSNILEQRKLTAARTALRENRSSTRGRLGLGVLSPFWKDVNRGIFGGKVSEGRALLEKNLVSSAGQLPSPSSSAPLSALPASASTSSSTSSTSSTSDSTTSSAPSSSSSTPAASQQLSITTTPATTTTPTIKAQPTSFQHASTATLGSAVSRRASHRLSYRLQPVATTSSSLSQAAAQYQHSDVADLSLTSASALDGTQSNDEFDTEGRRKVVLETLSPIFRCFMASNSASPAVFTDFEEQTSRLLSKDEPGSDSDDEEFFSLHNACSQQQRAVSSDNPLLRTSSSQENLNDQRSNSVSSSPTGPSASSSSRFRPGSILSAPKMRQTLPRKVELNDSTLKQGPLTKLGKINRNWQRRHFMLTPKNLYYFKNQSDVRPVGDIPLDENTTVRIDEEMLTKNFCFQISTPARKFFVFADNKRDMDSWLEMLNLAIANIKSGNNTTAATPPPPKSGFLTKQGGVVKNWKKRWFLLQNHVLYYFKTPIADASGSGVRNVSRASGSIPLDERCTVKHAPDTGKNNCLQINTRDRTYLAFADDAEQLEEWITAIRQSIITSPTE